MKIGQRFAGCILCFAFLAPQSYGFDQDLFKQEVQQIDDLVNHQLKAHHATPNPIADDGTFVRRAYLDIIGRIPTYTEATSFLTDTSKSKRSDLVVHLLKSNGYVHHYFHFWADLLRYKTWVNNNIPGMDLYGDWIKTSLAENKPYDVLVRELLTAEGHSYEEPTAGFYTRDPGMPLDHMANTVQVFLGTRMQCAQCHNHPFDKWTQQDFYSMAAFTFGLKTRGESEEFSHLQELQKMINQRQDLGNKEKKTQRKTVNDMFKTIQSGVFDVPKKLKLPKDYQYDDASPGDRVDAQPLFGAVEEISNPRQGLATWITSPDNQRFTTVIANRLWKNVMGLGLIEPTDDIQDDTDPSNPALMDYLEQLLISHDYNMKYFLNVLHHTKTYQRQASVRENTDTPYHFPGPLLRRMSAEQVWDSMMTLMVDDIDNAKPALLKGDVKKSRALTYSTRRRAELVKSLSALELQEIVEGQAKESVKYSRKQSELQLALKNTDDSAERKEIQNKLQDLKKEYNKFTDKQFAKYGAKTSMAGSMMTMDNIPSDAQGERAGKKMGKKAVKKKNPEFARASELRSPMYPGHFLREFGQSDRNVIENADYGASIPQALTLMNNYFIYPLINNSPLMETVQEASTLDKKLERLFITIRSRPPSDREKTLLASASTSKEKKTIADVTWSLINTSEFLFIQ